MKQLMAVINCSVLAVMLIIGGAAKADGQLMVMPARSNIEGQQSRTVQVSNRGDKPLYLQVDLQRIENPGETPERKTAIGDIATPGMMASPAKLTLGPGQKRDINLVPLQSPNKETLYQLYITPVSSIKTVGEESQEKISAPLTFGVGYGVVIHHLPPAGAQTQGWHYQCTDKGIQLTATGNVHNLFRDLQAIPAGVISTELKVFPGTPRVLALNMLKGSVAGKPFDIRCP